MSGVDPRKLTRCVHRRRVFLMPTPQTPVDRDPAEQVLRDLNEWMRSLPEDHLWAMGVKNSVEEPLRLLRLFAARQGFNLD